MALAAAAAAGLLLFTANPPLDLGPVAFVALIPLLWALDRAGGPRRGALVGFVFGLVYYGALLHWLIPFGIIAWLPLVVAQAAYAGAFGLVAPALLRLLRRRPFVGAAGLAAAWTVADWGRGSWPLGGFTWGSLAYSQHGNRLLLPLATVAGMWGVGFVVVTANALVLSAAHRAGEWRRAVPAAAVAAALVAAPVLIPIPAATGPRLDVAVIQGNVPLALASDRLLQTDAVAASHIALHRTLASDPPDLAVWPENALPEDPAADPALGAQVSDAVRAVGAPTLVGAVEQAPPDRYSPQRLYNQAVLYTGDGRIAGRYSKIHLVPGGEYVPFPRVFGWTNNYRRGNAVLAPGRGIRLFRVDGVKVGTPICFENVFPNLFRRFVADGAGLVVLTTNDSSFLHSEASREHVIISQLRAVETGRWVVQASISGESAVIDPSGVVRERTALFRRTILRAAVPTATGETPYVRFGDWFPWANGLALLLSAVALWARRRRRQPAEAPAERASRTDPLPIAGGAGAVEPRVLAILPTYNERETIARAVAGALAASPALEVLVVDDDSPDGTREVVEAMLEQEPRIHLLRRGGKQGLASAYLSGFTVGLERGFDLMVEMDADLSHDPAELPRLLDAARTNDLTIGSRYVPGGGVSNWSKVRLGLSKAGNLYARLALGLPVSDATSGYRVYRRSVLQALVDRGIHSDGYAFQIELAYQSWRMGFRVGEVPITFREREHGHSKLSRAIVVEAILKVTEWGIRDRILRRGSRPKPGAGAAR